MILLCGAWNDIHGAVCARLVREKKNIIHLFIVSGKFCIERKMRREKPVSFMPLNAVRHELLDKQFRSLFSLYSTFCLELFPRARTFLVSHYVLLLCSDKWIYFRVFSVFSRAHWIIFYKIKMSWFIIWKGMNEWKCERQEIVHEIEMEMFRPNVSSFGIFFSYSSLFFPISRFFRVFLHFFFFARWQSSSSPLPCHWHFLQPRYTQRECMEKKEEKKELSKKEREREKNFSIHLQ